MQTVTTTTALAALVLAGGQAMAGDWYFYVENNTSSTITRLEAKEKNGSWGSFQLGGGIKPGSTVKIEWAKSTDNQDCAQYIRASFADGSTADPVQFDFCDDLDTPITFEE
ncbi:hypothetical protein [Synechococcus sp. CS-1328]|uniref:hypothetical protein n=1 Tax=Synechococcus sp. CS-1328 TaxID=2847976 RepID=UPI00223AF010|nr:hypothetical protein [Synechococcus sp. CS-1328]